MKKILSILAVITIILLTAQSTNPGSSTSPGSGWNYVSSNCHSINLGIVTITTGEITYENTNPVTGVTDVMHVPCSKEDRWHWFWE